MDRLLSFDQCKRTRRWNSRNPGAAAIRGEISVSRVIDDVGDNLHAAVLAAEIAEKVDFLTGKVNRAGEERRVVAVDLVDCERLATIAEYRQAGIGARGRRAYVYGGATV